MEPAETVVVPQQIAASGEPPGTLPPNLRWRVSQVMAETIDAVIDTIAAAITKGDTVKLVGFGSFSPGSRAARVGPNPATGAEIQIPTAKTVKFTAGKASRKLSTPSDSYRD